MVPCRDTFVRTYCYHVEVLHVEVLLPGQSVTSSLDDLTNFPRRASVIDEMHRRVLARELFGVGVLNLREADAYRQDFGRSGLDQFVVLVSVLLRRHAAASTPISVGHLDDGNFLVIGPNSAVQEVIAQTTYEFDALVPAYYEMDTLFGADDSHDVGPSTWIALAGRALPGRAGRLREHPANRVPPVRHADRRRRRDPRPVGGPDPGRDIAR